MRTSTHAFTELRVETEQMVLLPWLRAAFHPLPLGHECNAFVHLGYEDYFRVLFYLNHLLSTVLGEEDAYSPIS